MHGVPAHIAEHSLDVQKDMRLVKEALDASPQKSVGAIREEIARLLTAGFIWEVAHPKWLANPIMVRKKNNS